MSLLLRHGLDMAMDITILYYIIVAGDLLAIIFMQGEGGVVGVGTCLVCKILIESCGTWNTKYR